MFLKNIKLAGFKSFADPVNISLPDKIAAFVGPNGCGKSNIVDALRWAIGERSARLLRGNQLEDVVFNGTDTRPAASRAAIELIFDNSDARIGGPYSSYTEVAVRRELISGQPSSFLLNDVRCRAKDIQELFLGTGLGARSYSIIEQGSISQIVNSKPEEMRKFLEEAAGVSRYRERRTETEQRINRTELNIARVKDSLAGILTELRVLKRQANAAKRYQELEEKERQLRYQLLSMNHIKASTMVDRIVADQAAIEAQINDLTTQITSLEADATAQVLELESARRSMNETQKDVYDLQVKIREIEMEHSHRKESLSRLHESLAANDTELAETKALIEKDEEVTQRLETRISDLENEKDRSQPKMSNALQAFSTFQNQTRDLENTWLSQHKAIGVKERLVETLSGRLESLRTQTTLIESQRSSLTAQLEKVPSDASDRDRIESQLLKMKQQFIDLETRRDKKRAELNELDEEISRRRERVDDTEKEIYDLKTRVDHLQTSINEHEVDQEDVQTLNAWRTNRSEQVANLIEYLHIESGWEHAVSVALGRRLGALATRESDINELLEDFVQQVTRFGAVVYSHEEQASSFASQADTLIDKVKEGKTFIADILAKIRCADSLQDALRIRSTLEGGESVITRNGIWFGKNWVVNASRKSDHADIFTLKRQLNILVQDVEKMTLEREIAEENLSNFTQIRAQLADEVGEMSDLSQALTIAINDESNELKLKVEIAQNRQVDIADKRASIGDLERQSLQIKEELLQIARDHESAIESLAEERQQFTTIDEQRSAVLDQRLALENEVKYAEESMNRITNELSLTQLALAEAKSRRQRESVRLNGIVSTNDRIRIEREAIEKVGTEDASILEKYNVQRVAAEEKLKKRSQAAASIAAKQAEIRDQINRLEVQERVEQEQLAARAEDLGRARQDKEQLDDQIKEIAPDQSPNVESTSEQTQAEIESSLELVLEHKQRLGAINQLAGDEHARRSEAKEETERQLSDLHQALDKLRIAIKKIDTETRQTLQATFDQVNVNLERLFPRLFGGGTSALELTGENLLDAGLVIRATPPSKKNIGINLLSGGEKALAALAFIFALFLLNPSPLCVLDEVDAPLDEQNVLRFMNLIDEMSGNTQFILITHNPATMEHAGNLIGVTMEEPGISRVVSASLKSAMEYVNS